MEVSAALKHVFGIHEFDVAYKLTSKKEDDIGASVLKLIKGKEFKTFKVVTKRSDKKFPYTSMEFSRKIGAVILKNCKILIKFLQIMQISKNCKNDVNFK